MLPDIHDLYEFWNDTQTCAEYDEWSALLTEHDDLERLVFGTTLDEYTDYVTRIEAGELLTGTVLA